ncbi:PP2C family protein-serine/threonine phosphatase [Streptosporangium sp. NPDC023615]|uniref:PP2C family protein-serine/threonine phosphatase n=1 Tax=Streptosporangium sp. NPDC023615 TaxID=3154794 RepID=UPI0034301DA8
MDGGDDEVGVRRGTARMLTGLLKASHLCALEEVPPLVTEYAAHAGLGEVLIYLADLQQEVLRLLTGHGKDAGGETDGHAAELRIDATLAGRGFQESRVLFHRAGGDDEAGQGHWWMPLLDGTERLGVLRVEAPADIGEEGQETMRALAAAVALIVASKRAHSDSYARLVRTRRMHVAAEMQWKLTPPLTFANTEVVISAALEPAYEVGGDAFDYAVGGDLVHLGIFDAMGHDVSAGLTASLALAACRNNRRQGMDLAANSETIEKVLIAEFGRATRFVTAVLAELHVPTGMLTWINRGHYPPVVIRGGRAITTLGCPPAHPMGLDFGLPVTLCREQLQPGDRVLFYTDGITEARNRTGQEFGLQRFVDFIVRHHSDGLPVSETLRRLIHHVLRYHDGRLQDDATVLMVEWHGSAYRRLTPN